MDAAVVGDAEVGGGTAELLVEGSFEELLAGNSETVSSLFCRASVRISRTIIASSISRARRDRLLDLRGWRG